MVSITSGSSIDVLVPSLVSSFGADRKGISRFTSCIPGRLWIGVFIYLFLRNMGAGVAKISEIFYVYHGARSHRWDQARSASAKNQEDGSGQRIG